jgi:hypothetical protein
MALLKTRSYSFDTRTAESVTSGDAAPRTRRVMVNSGVGTVPVQGPEALTGQQR